ncbi:MAG TPA: hypothetical protein VN175_03930 [Rhizomicrobium sp.]|nr:hypothetical protein [Rhizomicrobium sp.]
MKFLVALLAALFLVSGSGIAQEHQFVPGEAVHPDPGMAYILARTQDMAGGGLRGTESFSVLLYRILTDAELEQYKAVAEQDPQHLKDKVPSNVTVMSAVKAIDPANGQKTMLVAVKPGIYVLGGMTAANWASTETGAMVASLCMGTVKFEAKPGTITDMGTVLLALDNRTTDIPELAKYVTGKENELNFTNIVGVRPAQSSTAVPAAVAGLSVIQADYYAMPAFPNYARAALSRLAPLPGVLDYDKNGDVVDLKAAKTP